MQLLSVNVSRPREIDYQGTTVRTGIFKEPVPGRVMLRRLNLEGDGQADLTVHGGPDKAVYVYPREHYAYWQQELGRDDFALGQFGENFTIEGLLEDGAFIGDVFRIGNAAVEISQPRVPCFKLALKMDLPTFPKLFLKSGRTGFYVRVLEEGDVGAGDAIDLLRSAVPRISVRAVCHLLYFDARDVEGIRQVLEIDALSTDWRAEFERRLQKAERHGSQEK